jgi:phosphomannomutase
MGEEVIKFGTDGWRGVIAYDFTADRVKIVTRGVCEYLKHKIKTGSKTLKVVIGYDTRFLSEKFAEITASVFRRNNIEAYISTSFVPTPILSAGVLKNNADLGIMITASHNPYYYNGYKVKGSYGGSATMDIISGIEESVDSQVEKYDSDFTSGDEILGSDDNIEKLDFVPEYSKQILNLVDTDAIKNFDFGLLIDPMYGACQGIYRNILQSLNPKEVIEIHGVINPLFNGINPEPIGDNLRDAIYKLKEKKCKLAICLDGDGDRIAALGEDGNFISSHHIFAIILWYLLKYKQLRGKVVKTVTTSSIIDRICSKYDLELLT